MVVSLVIILGLSIVTVPQAVSYIATRHLDDAIFKLESGSSWPESILEKISGMDGVKNIENSSNHSRLVVTYDRRMVKISGITALFRQQDLLVTLLNQVNHRQHQNTLKKEEEELETP